MGYTIDSGEGETSVTREIFHEDEAYLIVSDGSEIALAVFFEQQFPRFRTVVKRLERQVFGNGGHQAIGVTLIVIGGMIVLRCPYVGNGALWNGLEKKEFGSLDVEQRMELFVSSESLAAFKNWTVGSAERLEYDDEEEKSNGKEEAPSQPPPLGESF